MQDTYRHAISWRESTSCCPGLPPQLTMPQSPIPAAMMFRAFSSGLRLRCWQGPQPPLLLQPQQQKALQLQPASKSSMSLLRCCSCPAPPPKHNTPLPTATTHSDTPLCMAQGHAPLSPQLPRLESIVAGCQLALRLVQVSACAVSRGSTAARSLHCCRHFNSLLRLCSRLREAPSFG